MISFECGIRNDTIVYVCLCWLCVSRDSFGQKINLKRFDSSCRCLSMHTTLLWITLVKSKLFHIYSSSSAHSVRHMPHAVIIELVHQSGLKRWNETKFEIELECDLNVYGMILSKLNVLISCLRENYYVSTAINNARSIYWPVGLVIKFNFQLKTVHRAHVKGF